MLWLRRPDRPNQMPLRIPKINQLGRSVKSELIFVETVWTTAHLYTYQRVRDRFHPTTKRVQLKFVSHTLNSRKYPNARTSDTKICIMFANWPSCNIIYPHCVSVCTHTNTRTKCHGHKSEKGVYLPIHLRRTHWPPSLPTTYAYAPTQNMNVIRAGDRWLSVCACAGAPWPLFAERHQWQKYGKTYTNRTHTYNGRWSMVRECCAGTTVCICAYGPKINGERLWMRMPIVCKMTDDQKKGARHRVCVRACVWRLGACVRRHKCLMQSYCIVVLGKRLWPS